MNTLDGILVVSVEQAVAAPFATRQLADLGARVIKVEPPGRGDFARRYDDTVHGMSSYFAWLNRGKESIEADLKSPEGRQLMGRLLDRADIFVSNLSPSATRALSLDAPTLARRHQRLIVCSIDGYGPDGPYSDRRAYDLLIQGETGLLSVTGWPDAPAKAGISVADIATGMYAFSGALASLLERERLGSTTSFGVAMIDALGEWMMQPYLFGRYGGQPPQATGAHHSTIAPYGPFTCADGETILVAVQNDAEWQRFCLDVLSMPSVSGDPRFADNPARVRHRHDLDTLVEGVFATLTADRTRALLAAAGIATGSVNSMAEFADHPQLTARDRWRKVGSRHGSVRQLLPPIRVTGRQPPMGPIPDLGEHTAAVADEFGGAERTPHGDSELLVRIVTEEASAALANLMPEGRRPMSDVPPLWHWAHLVDRTSGEALGPDGHLASGVPDGVASGSRRMAAGGRIRTIKPLRHGERAIRTTRVIDVRRKHGRSGLLIFMTVRHEITQRGAVAIVEEQDVVYRAPGGQLPANLAGPPTQGNYRPRLRVDFDSVMLFRFSALTNNTHRIHYDYPYALHEGYPGLVVHGPLSALLMREALIAEVGATTGSSEMFSYRLFAPLFSGQSASVETAAVVGGGGYTALVRSSTDEVTATAQLTLDGHGS